MAIAPEQIHHEDAEIVKAKHSAGAGRVGQSEETLTAQDGRKPWDTKDEAAPASWRRWEADCDRVEPNECLR